MHSPQKCEIADSWVDTNCNVKWSNHSKLSHLQWSYIGQSPRWVSHRPPQQVEYLFHKISIQEVYSNIKWKMKSVVYEVGTCNLLYTYFYFPYFHRILFSCYKDSMQSEIPLSDCVGALVLCSNYLHLF